MTDAPAPGIHQKAIDALMSLLAEKKWDGITLPEIAARAGVTLSDLRGAFPSKGAVLAGFSRQIDQQALKIDEAEAFDMELQPVRERLFDVIMRRFDALAPYRQAIRSARSGLLRDPLAASAWNRVEVTSAQWMLAAAGIKESGPLAALRAQTLALIFARTLRVWLDESDPDLPRTMKELDHQLRRAERLAQTGNATFSVLRPFINFGECILGGDFRGRRKKTESEDPRMDPDEPVPAI